MNIQLVLNIAADCTPESLEALLSVASRYHTEPAPEPARERSTPVARECGPNEAAYLAASGNQRMRLTAEFAGMDRETAAMVKLAQLNAGGAPSVPAEREAPDYDDAGGDGFEE